MYIKDKGKNNLYIINIKLFNSLLIYIKRDLLNNNNKEQIYLKEAKNQEGEEKRSNKIPYKEEG